MISGLIRLGVGAWGGLGVHPGDQPSDSGLLFPWIVREGPSVGSDGEFRTAVGGGGGR